MKKKRLIVMLSLLLFLTGCSSLPHKIPLEDIQAILIAGIDVSEGMVELTVMSVGSQPGSGDKKGEEAIKIYEATGKTVFEAKQNLSLYNDKHLIWAHLEYIIIGEDTARAGIAPHLDFFLRHHENRLTDDLIVAKNMTAREFIRSTDTAQPKINEKIRHLFKDAEIKSTIRNVNLKTWALKHLSDTMYVILPVLSTTERTHKEKEQQEEGTQKKDIRTDGYAVFNREGKLIDYASLEYSRGINWITDEIHSTAVVIEPESGAQLSAQIIRSKTKLEIDEEAVSLNVDISLIFNIPEYTGNKELYDLEYGGLIKGKLEDMIEKEVIDTVKYLQSLDADAINIGNVYYHKYPKRWPMMKDMWEEKFRQMNVNVSVRSTLRNTYNILNPMEKE
jgi:spore germination protein KC